MSAVFQLAVLVALAVVVASSTDKKDIPICSADKSCFTHPADCKFEDCDFVLSIGPSTTEIYAKSVSGYEFFIVQAERSGLLDERIFTCFGNNEFCYLGEDKNIEDLPYTIDSNNRLDAKVTVVSAANNDYIYELPGGIIPYTPKMKYFFRTGTAGIYTKPIVRIPLNLIKDAAKQFDLNEEINTYITENVGKNQETVRDERFKRIAEPEYTVPLDFVLQDHFGQAVPV